MTTLKQYPAGALVRVSDICRDPKAGKPGILPITRSTWHRWVADGRAPQPKRLGGTPVWPIEQVTALAQSPETA